MEEGISLLVWDTDDNLPKGHSVVVLWQSYSIEDNNTETSISQLVEDNSEHFRMRYLALIYELGEVVVKGKRVIEHLEIGEGFSYWWTTLLAEKCNFAKSSQIDNAIKLIAFREWFKGKNY